MPTFLIEKAFLPSLAHNDVFACDGLERLIQTTEMVKKILLSGKCGLFAEKQADVEIETARMI